MANVLFNALKAAVLKADIDFESDTIKAMLVTASYTPNQDTHNFKDDITNEVTGTGYTAGGAPLGSKTVTQNDTDNWGVFDAADVTWNRSAITVRLAAQRPGGGAAPPD